MTTQEEIHLTDLCSFFSVKCLGEGDHIAGINTLAAMAITLANVARPGSGIGKVSGKRLRVNSSILVTGSLSTSLIADNVLNPLHMCQNHLVGNLRSLIRSKRLHDAKDGPKIKFPEGPADNDSQNSLYNLQRDQPALFVTHDEEWANVLASPPTQSFEDLATHSKIVVTANRLSDLEKQLAGLHLGHPIVVYGLNANTRPADANRIAEIFNGVMDGLCPDGHHGETVRGSLLIMDPNESLTRIVKDGNECGLWLGRICWLTDSNSGPDYPLKPKKYEGKYVPDVIGGFSSAISLALGKRLNNQPTGPVVHDIDLGAAQRRWVSFLKKMEPDLPGVCGNARTLLASLAFGLHELLENNRLDPKLVSVEQVEAFARFLICRMVNARSAMVFDKAEAQRQKLQSAILVKLADGPITPRDLTRRFNSLRIDDCQEALQALVSKGSILNLGGAYTLRSDPANQASQLSLSS